MLSISIFNIFVQVIYAQIIDPVIEPECEIKDAALTRSLIGKQARVRGRGDGHVMHLNIGDTSSVQE